MSGLFAAIAAGAGERADEPAILWDDQTVTYGDLLDRAAAASARLVAAGVGAGDRVAVGLHNSPELVETLLGTLRLGAIYVPLNPAYTADEAAYAVEHSGARLLLTHPQLREALAVAKPELAASVVEQLPAAGASRRPEPAAVDPVQPALIVYTSGTTGRPKGATLSHRALENNLRAIGSAWAWSAGDRLLLTLPCSHLHGLALGLLASFLHGSSVVLRPRFEAASALADLEGSGCTAFFAVPTMYGRLVQLEAVEIQRRDFGRMRLWACGSAPLLPVTFERFRTLFGADIAERYGMSEGGFMIAAPYREPRRPGVVGRAVRGVELRLVDDEEADRGVLRDVGSGSPGELVVRGDNLFSGYWRDEEATARAFLSGWFRTGDLAVREADGQYRIVGRISADIIKNRGYKVGAVEIEDRLQECPGVREVAVVGVPHADWGQEIVAVIAPDPQAPPAAEDILAHARAALAPYKVPSRVVFVDDIPKVGPGKFRKAELVRRLGGQS